ncbi:MAG: HAMP domain-containing sensor histidine kinase [Pseudomonadota bacterium]
MRLKSIFAIYGGAFLLMTGLLSGITLWSTAKSKLSDQRIDLAETSFHLHLSLESNIYQLLKQHGDALIIGDRDEGAMEAELRDRINANISEIRTIIAREIDLVGEEEIEELELLARIEAKVQRLTRNLTALSTDGGDPLDPDRRRSWLVDVLDRQIDVELSNMITQSLEEERQEVVETMAEAAATRAWINTVVTAALIAAVIMIVLFGISFLRFVQRPFDQLLSAAGRYREGRFEPAPPLDGARDLSELGDVLGEMARALARREATRREQQDNLERTVKERTVELESLLRQFETSEASRRQLLADISHELRTPLTIIQGEAEVSLRGTPEMAETQVDSFARIRDAARHTNRIVDDLLMIARQRADQLRLDLRECDMRHVIDQATGLFPRPVKVSQEGGPHRARVDPVRMRQCLLAVLQNARRYGGQSITIQLGVARSGVRMLIEDDGPGMTDAEKRQAFDRFYRGPSATAGAEEGTGLGLPIVRSIMEAHGGSVALLDVPTGGLGVELILPPTPGPRLVGGSPDAAADVA